MKKVVVLLGLIMFSMNIANADPFSLENPFCNQTNPERFNNIYETEPAYATKPMQEKRKFIFWKNKDVEKYTEDNTKDTIPVYGKGTSDSSFTAFPKK